ncbi:hypothetical protein FEM03_17185 [Phragmitibacter flavus]|uniref:PEP-CTERM sorting domain-containing protein n=1 Tax=Phragmitibacter flavus TaxID=2576071 RepID=A0A5R8KAQ0_9BACT|nr:hypothetical protein [Phragmitibacter flavus]TLD69381.1 hypothetical protein FEM03_17185 [Phragmitibacter flavus]
MTAITPAPQKWVINSLLAVSFLILTTSLSQAVTIFVRPTAVTAAVVTGYSVDSTFDRAIDGSGLSNAALVATGQLVPALVTSGPTHTETFGTNTARFFNNANLENQNGQGTSFTPAGVSLTFNLGDTYDIGGLWLWNYREGTGNRLNRGIDSVFVEFSTNGTDWTNGQTINPALINSSGQAQSLTFTGTNTGIQFIRFSSFSNFGPAENSNFIGFSEIRFTAEAIPEPGISLLGTMGLMALTLRRRRSRQA